MSARCFSWCRLLARWGAKKQSTETASDERLPENRLAVIPATISVENRVTEPESNEEAIGVALKIIELCEDASAVEQRVKELQDRVGHLMIVIVAHVTAKNEEGSKDEVVKAAKGIEGDIKGLLRTLGTINQDLTEISTQNRWVITFYKEINMNTLEDCINRLSTTLERFQLANDLRDSDLLQKLQTRLEKIQHLTQHVANKMDNIDHKVEDIHAILFKIKRSGALLHSDTVVRQEMPLKPEIFHGRDDVVENISRLLVQEKTSRICILGPGGMGKTSVSLAVVESLLVQEWFPPRTQAWVPCVEATSATLLLEILYVQLQIPGDKHVTLERIISELDASKRPRLIVLDNFETPWNALGRTQKQVGDILRKLATLSHIAILVTMHGTYPPCDTIGWQTQTIQPTDKAACRRIFHDINPSSKDDPDVNCLLAELGHMPFAVTLMANLGKRGKSMAKELLDTWYISGTDMLSITNSPEKSMNRSISLSVDSEFVKQNPDALLLLSILSLLPAGTTRENLCWWAPTAKMIPSAIATLSDAALLVENKRHDSNSQALFVLPVVQSFMQQHDQISGEIRKQLLSSCCQYILDHACHYDDPTFPIKSKALAAEDPNIQSILLSSLSTQLIVSSNRITEALIDFSWHRCDTKPNLNIANHAVMAARASGLERCIASMVWCLGKTYHQLGDHRLSYNHLEEAYRVFNALPRGDGDLNSQQLGGQCGIDLVDIVCLALDDNDRAVALAQDVETKCATLSDKLIHGRSLMFLGYALSEPWQWQEALVHLDHARSLLKAMESTPDLADVCQLIAGVHYYEKRLPEALYAIEDAWRYAELIDSPFIQAVTSLAFGMILFTANRDIEAWKHIKIALTRASDVGNRLTGAQALEYMGYGYLRRGDYQNSYGAYEAAAEQYVGTVYDWCETRCRDNMVRIKQKQGNTGAAVGFYRPDLDVDKALFYSLDQVSWTVVPVSGS